MQPVSSQKRFGIMVAIRNNENPKIFNHLLSGGELIENLSYQNQENDIHNSGFVITPIMFDK